MKLGSEVLSLLNAEALRLRLGQENEINLSQYTNSLNSVPVVAEISHSNAYENLNKIFDIISFDVRNAGERMNALNAGRKKILERRVEFLARRLAVSRGEKFQQTINLDQLIHGEHKASSVVHEAWVAFQAEIALYNIFELFFLKALDFHGWRKFEFEDLRRLNFCSHQVLNHRAVGFSTDNHCWNFVRNNLYSWYVPSIHILPVLQDSLIEIDNVSPLAWSDTDLLHWITQLAEKKSFQFIQFKQEIELSESLIGYIEKQLKIPFVYSKGSRSVCSKVYIPVLNRGGTALCVLDRYLSSLQGSVNAQDKNLQNDSLQLQNALWACESESFELFWTEVMALLKTISKASSDKVLQYVSNNSFYQVKDAGDQRFPHLFHGVNKLGLELHNIDQLPLSGPELSMIQQGSAGKIQQSETYDLSVIIDCPHQQKSAAWVQALAEQLPYWKNLIRSNSCLNWGELHLFLGLSKLKENGQCVYLTHRPLPDGKDGDRLRKEILSQCTLVDFAEFENASGESTMRYRYTFKKTSEKVKRDTHRPHISKYANLQDHLPLDVKESNVVQSEMAELGWNHMFAQGNSQLVRYMNQKHSKLFQIASVTTFNREAAQSAENILMDAASKNQEKALYLYLQNDGYKFLTFESHTVAKEKPLYVVHPHHAADLRWLEHILNSALAQKWIQYTRKQCPNGLLRMSDVKNLPVIQWKQMAQEEIQFAQEQLGSLQHDLNGLKNWCEVAIKNAQISPQSFYLAITSRLQPLEKLIARYRPLFKTWDCILEGQIPELNPNAVTHFYPERLLAGLRDVPEIKVSYVKKECSPLSPESWVVTTVHALSQAKRSVVVIQTKQGPFIQISMPSGSEKYVASQIQELIGRNWSEVSSTLRIPKDFHLFQIQSMEILKTMTRVFEETQLLRRVLGELTASVYEIPSHISLE